MRIFWDTNTSYDPATDDPHTIPPTPTGKPAGSGSDSVTWTVPLLLAGTYYIGGVITAGTDTAVVYAGGINVAGPQLTLTHPDAVDTANPMMIGDPVTIQWSNTIPGNNPTMVLFYNSTASTVGATTIASGLNPNNQTPAKTYNWVIPSGVASQVYIGATVTDDLGQTATSFAPGVITIPDPKQFDRDLADMTSYPDGSQNDSTRAILVFQGESAGGSLGQATKRRQPRRRLRPADTGGKWGTYPAVSVL